MQHTLIRYKTKPESTAANEGLIKNVFQELKAKAPEGVRYLALKLADGSFIHFVAVEAADGKSPIPGLEAFKAFQTGIRERTSEPPLSQEATIVGNYRMLAE